MGADGETCQLFIWIFNYYDGHSPDSIRWL